jgi:hypothetical protein
MFGDDDLEEWNELQAPVKSVYISEEDDEIQWGLTSSKMFTTKLLYKLITSGGVNSGLLRSFGDVKSH